MDTGGTFTDVVDDQGRVRKVSSTPADPGLAVRAGIASVASGRPDVLVHGTTVATNALLERRGATVALFTTEGFVDLIEIAGRTGRRCSITGPTGRRRSSTRAIEWG